MLVDFWLGSRTNYREAFWQYVITKMKLVIWFKAETQLESVSYFCTQMAKMLKKDGAKGLSLKDQIVLYCCAKGRVRHVQYLARIQKRMEMYIK